MTSPDNPKRCTNIVRQRDGTQTECSDTGTWTFDKTHKTWRPSQPTDKARRCWAHGPGAEQATFRTRTRRIQPNARINQAAGILEYLAPEVTKALMEIADELSMLGFPGSSNRGSSYIDAPDPVGNDAARIAEVTAYREDLRDWIDDLCNRVNSGVLLVARIRNVRHAHGVKLCNEMQQGRQGSIEWGNPTCTELPLKNGLCDACYKRQRRWLNDHDLPTADVPAA